MESFNPNDIPGCSGEAIKPNEQRAGDRSSHARTKKSTRSRPRISLINRGTGRPKKVTLTNIKNGKHALCTLPTDSCHTGLPQSISNGSQQGSVSVLPSTLRSQENICPGIYCEYCEKFSAEPCWNHTCFIPNTPSIPFAVASLPDSLTIAPCCDFNGKGVFTKIRLCAQTVFGPIVGMLCSGASTTIFPFPFISEAAYATVNHFHMESDYCCNWMRYVRFAENKEEQNLMVCLRNSEIFFVTTKLIRPGEELKVWYSLSYAEMTQVSSSQSERTGLAAADLGSQPQSNGSVKVNDQILPAEKQQNAGEQKKKTEPSKRASLRIKIPKCRTSRISHTDPESPLLPPTIEQEMPLLQPYSNTEDQVAIKMSEGEKPGTPDPLQLYGDVNLGTGQVEEKDPPRKGKRPYNKKKIKPGAPKPPPKKRGPKPRERVETEKDQMRRTLNLQRKYLKTDPESVIKFPCTECLTHFPSGGLLDLHAHQHLGEFEGLKRECPCGSAFKSFNELMEHVITHGTKYYAREKCAHCEDLISVRNMALHMRYAHPEKCADVQKVDAQKQKLKHCLLCAKIESSWRRVGEHALTHQQPDGFHCNICPSVLPTYRSLLQHHRRNHDVTQIRSCTLCNKTFIHADRLRRHMKYHARLYEHSCDICDKSFCTGHLLSLHKRCVHEAGGREKFRAKYQEKVRKGRKQYTNPRQRMVYEEFPYKCELCREGFMLEGRLVRHQQRFHVSPG